MTLQFAFEVVENAINDWWDLTILEFAQNYDSEYLEYVFEQLDRLNIKTKYKKGEDYELIKKD